MWDQATLTVAGRKKKKKKKKKGKKGEEEEQVSEWGERVMKWAASERATPKGAATEIRNCHNKAHSTKPQRLAKGKKNKKKE